jgi:hypothetical protein
LVLQDFGMEGFFETVTANGHHFCTHGNADLNAARRNLIRNVLCGLETGWAKSIYGGCGSGIWEASCQGSGSELVCRFSIGDLQVEVLADEVAELGGAYIATADILD